MFERIRQRLIRGRREIEIHRGLLRHVLIPLIPYYIAGLPTYVLLVADAGFDHPLRELDYPTSVLSLFSDERRDFWPNFHYHSDRRHWCGVDETSLAHR